MIGRRNRVETSILMELLCITFAILLLVALPLCQCFCKSVIWIPFVNIFISSSRGKSKHSVLVLKCLWSRSYIFCSFMQPHGRIANDLYSNILQSPSIDLDRRPTTTPANDSFHGMRFRFCIFFSF